MQAVKSFLFLHIITVSDAILFVLAGVWFVLVVLGLWSVFSSPKSPFAKVAWSLLIILIPVAGLFFYTAVCFFSADWGILTQMGFFSLSRKKIASSLETSIPHANKSPSS
jgi:hypothetical protein